MEEEDISLGQPFPNINNSNYKAPNDDSFIHTLHGLNDQYEEDGSLPNDEGGRPARDPDCTTEKTRKGTKMPVHLISTQKRTYKKKENDKPEQDISATDIEKNTKTSVDIKVRKKRGPYKKRKPKEGQEQKKRNRQPKDPTIMDSYCHQCEKLFTERYALLMHCHKEHGGELPTKDYLCVHCGKTFGTNPILRHHIRHVHIEQPLVTCPVCSKQIKKVGFNGHMAKHKEEPVCCDLCGMVMSKYSMDQHIKAVHLQMRPYPCEWPGCGKSFKDRKHLKQHSFLHTDEKPIQCQYCDYACRQTQSLKWHMNHTHPEIPVDYSPTVPANQKLRKVNV